MDTSLGQLFERPSRENTCAVVTTYYPDISFPNRIKAIANQVGRVVIVDNGSGVEAQDLLVQVAKDEVFELILNTDNLGVATALNQGVNRALCLGFKWVALFDQDSVPAHSFLGTLSRIYTSFPEKHQIGIIGANYIHANSGLPALECTQKEKCEFLEVKSVITSGSLLNLAAFQSVGKFRDDFFIDQVDEEFCLRLRSHGWKVLMSCKPLLICAIGNPTSHRFLWKQVYSSNHSAIRRYYITRNRVVLWKKYLLKEPKWALQSMRSTLMETILILFCENKKLAKLRAIALGVLHGLIGRMGRLKIPGGL